MGSLWLSKLFSQTSVITLEAFLGSLWPLMVGGTPCRHCQAGTQNGSQDTGRPRAFLNGQFRLLKAKIGKKT